MDPIKTKLVNLAFRVPRLRDAETMVEISAGWSKNAVHAIDGAEFLEASFGDVRVNFFETAIYDGDQATQAGGFLHASFEVADLDAALADPAWKDRLVWGPSTIKGGFGHRRIAFFEPIAGCRIELMEQIDD